MRLALLSLVLLPLAAPTPPGCSSGCPWEKENYSSDIGVPGVPLEPGDLAGTWYAQWEFSTLINLPIFGERTAGSNGGRLVKLTYDAGQAAYTMEARFCWNDVFEVAGTSNTITDEQLSHLRPVFATLDSDNEKGEFLTRNILDLWGIRDMPDPENTSLPNKDNYEQEPQSTWIFDEDQDGKLAITTYFSGNVRGEGYYVHRAVFTLDGVAKSKDELIGLVVQQKVEEKMLRSTVNIAGQSAADTDQRPDPDPKHSWFQMIRGSDTGTCEDVKAARDNRTLSSRRPF
jgi:hypothetical protein